VQLLAYSPCSPPNAAYSKNNNVLTTTVLQLPDGPRNGRAPVGDGGAEGFGTAEAFGTAEGFGTAEAFGAAEGLRTAEMQRGIGPKAYRTRRKERQIISRDS
jgi:hypothetical protein